MYTPIPTNDTQNPTDETEAERKSKLRISVLTSILVDEIQELANLSNDTATKTARLLVGIDLMQAAKRAIQ